MATESTQRDTLRRSLRQARRRQSRQQRPQAQHAAFVAEPGLLAAPKVAAYLAFDGEVDSAALIAALRKAGRRCYVPVLGEASSLEFRHYAEDQPLILNRYGIQEPGPQAATIRPEELDLVLTAPGRLRRPGHPLGNGRRLL